MPSFIPTDQMAAEVDFYESPEAQAIMTKSRDTFGVVVWPDPGSMGLSAEQSAAITKFHETVKQRAAIAAQNSDATDAMMTAETDGPGQDPRRRLRQLLQNQRL